MTSSHDPLVYKILSTADWQTAQALGYTRTALDKGDGYVHLSTRAQVGETLALHYAGQDQVQLLEYHSHDLADPLVWEESRGGQLFPHLYARLPVERARRIWTLSLGPAGHPDLPKDLDA